jgi:hypothetical protein
MRFPSVVQKRRTALEPTQRPGQAVDAAMEEAAPADWFCIQAPPCPPSRSTCLHALLALTPDADPAAPAPLPRRLRRSRAGVGTGRRDDDRQPWLPSTRGRPGA